MLPRHDEDGEILRTLPLGEGQHEDDIRVGSKIYAEPCCSPPGRVRSFARCVGCGFALDQLSERRQAFASSLVSSSVSFGLAQFRASHGPR